VAWLVYDFIGLAILRRAWFNVDFVWSLSLVLATPGSGGAPFEKSDKPRAGDGTSGESGYRRRHLSGFS
jgi:hypothetical protein